MLIHRTKNLHEFACSDPRGFAVYFRICYGIYWISIRRRQKGIDIEEYIRREVLPYVPDAWEDVSKRKKGYEIPFTRYFYHYEEVGDAESILRDIETLGKKIQEDIAALFEARRD